MPYATPDDMTTRYSERELIELTVRDNTAATVDLAVLDRALLDADAEIDARLQTRYTLPLPTVPRLLVNIACDIARYRLYDDRATDQVTRRYEDAVRLLDKIGKGDISLGLDAATGPTAPSGGPSFTEPVRTFSAGQLSDYAG